MTTTSTIRTALSKKLRFEIFKRDEFTCQYCGRKPPEVVLEVDHIVAVNDGGNNEDHNLLTSCFDCNRGKSDTSLNLVPKKLDVAEQKRLIEERREQVKAYENVLSQEREEIEEKIDQVIAIYDYMFDHAERFNFERASIRNFLRHLPLPMVQEAMELACERMRAGKVFKYFCGICWRKIKRINGEE